MRRRIWMTILAFCALLAQGAYAVPAYPGKKTFTRQDGTQITLQLVGDEYFHYYKAEDGTAYRLQNDGSLRLLGQDELNVQKENAVARWKQQNAERVNRARRRVGNFPEGGFTGKKRGLVILVAFRDCDFVTSDPNAVFTQFFNETGYSYNGMAGSVRDYFNAQSYGKLDVEFDVVGPYKLSKNMSYYGGNNENGNDSAPQAMAEEASRLADPDVNYRNYDWDGDGQVDQIFFIYAGYGENYGAASNTIWPHASIMPSKDMMLDHMKLWSYACTSELMGAKGEVLAGIGTACHEFSHCLGLPDTYDTTYSGGKGMGLWDLMCSGNYNKDGYVPAGYTALERWSAGWLDPVEVTEYTEVKDMKPLEEAPEAYVLYNEANRNEFYLLENRQQVGFDAGLPGHGLMVTHTDYEKNAWESNSTNDNPNHQRITYVPADGKMTSNGDAGDPFPGKNGVHNLTDFTSPAAIVYNANTDGEKLMHKPIENIMETEGGFLSFSVMKPELAIPVPEISRTEDRLVLNWAAVEGADAYEVRYTELKAQGGMEESCLFAEDFAGTYSASAGFKDVGSELINYLKTSGFSGKNLFLTPDLLRLGSSSKQGELVSPTISALNTGRMTIVLTLKPFKVGEEAKAEFSIYTNSGTQESFDLAFSDKKTFVIHSEKVYAEALRMKLVAETRCYISYFAVYDGVFDIPADQTRAMTRAGIEEVTVKVEGTSFVIENADPTSTFQMEVRAWEKLRYGKWSEKIESAPEGSAIPLLPQDKPLLMNRWFDLNGRSISEPSRPGIYIYNGKKVVK